MNCLRFRFAMSRTEQSDGESMTIQLTISEDDSTHPSRATLD